MAFRNFHFFVITGIFLVSPGLASASSSDSELCRIRPDLCDEVAPVRPRAPEKKSNKLCANSGKNNARSAECRPKAKGKAVKIIKKQGSKKVASSFSDYFRANSNNPSLTSASVPSSAFNNRRTPASSVQPIAIKRSLPVPASNEPITAVREGQSRSTDDSAPAPTEDTQTPEE